MRVAIDIGGMSTKVCVLDEEINVIHRENFAYPVNSSSFIVEENLIKIIAQLMNNYQIDSIGIAVPGVVDSKTGLVTGLSALTDREIVNYKTSFQKKFNVPVYIDNDANCAAIGEMVFGNASNYSDVAFFVIGTGVGGAICLNKKLHKGIYHLGGEMGCMLEKNTQTGEWQNMSSRSGMHALENKYFSLAKIKKSGKEIYECYKKDQWARTAIEYQIENLSIGILNTAYVIDPQAILIGGGISQNDLFLELLQTRISEISEEVGMPAQFVVQKCKFTNDSNIFGAGALHLIQATY